MAKKSATKSDGSAEAPAVPYEPTEQEIAAKRAETLNQMTRAECIEVLKRQRAHDDALEAEQE
jgi:hypothetical protein